MKEHGTSKYELIIAIKLTYTYIMINVPTDQFYFNLV